MKTRLLNRSWISPFTFFTFLVVTITSILLTFHAKTSSVIALHKWIGYAFILTACIHFALNWRKFTFYFRKRSAILAVFAGIILSLVVLYAGEGKGKPGRGNPFVQVFDLNGNGCIDAKEISVAAASLNSLDADKDGKISSEETVRKRGKGGEESFRH